MAEEPSDPSPGAPELDPADLLARAIDTVRPSAGASEWVPPTPEELARLLPQYRIDGLLGRGGMGAVYKCWQPQLERPVAIKLLPAEFALDQTFVARFQREARTLAKLQHPRIITIHDFGQTSEGNLYFVMEYIDGTDLRQILRGPSLDAEQALGVVGQLCDALQAAHRVGVVHRDIKPENVLITSDGYVKLADFGLAQPPREDGHTVLTGTNVVLGTPSYMAPEQFAAGGKADARSDIFALGVMFYEMLTGRRPQGVFDPPSHKVQVDVRIDGVVLKALQSEPERRYQSVVDLKSDVDRIQTTPPPPPPAPARPRVVARPAASSRRGKYAVGALIVMLLGVIAYLMAKQAPVANSLRAGASPLPAAAPPRPEAVVRAASPAPAAPPTVTPVASVAAPAPAATPAVTPIAVARLATPAASPPQPVLEPLREALLTSPWEWTHAPNPPDYLTFHADGTATCPRFSWHWKITGPRTATAFDAVQGDKRLPGFNAVITFDETLSTLRATTGDGRFVYTGRRLASLPVPPVAPAVPTPAAATMELFNGRDLTGWAGLKEFWSVKDGAITGTTKGGPARDNTFLVWQGGELGDFELSAKFKLTAEGAKGFSNSGVQYRSKLVDPSYYVMSGYQVDLALGPERYTGMLYEERGRSILAKTGQKVSLAGAQNSSTVSGSLGNPDALLASFVQGGWNDCRIVATGNHLQHFINGQPTVDVIDDGSGAARRGLLGLQLHKGAPMTVQFKEIRLKRMDAR